MPDIRKNIAANITKYRKLMKLSQKELAKAVGAKSLTTVSSWERAANAPDVETIFKLCDLFNISVDELYGVNIIGNKTKSTFERYLETLGYIVIKNPPEEGKEGYWEEQTDEYGNTETVWIDIQSHSEQTVTVKNSNFSITFYEMGYEKFKKDIEKSIEYLVWQKSQEQK